MKKTTIYHLMFKIQGELEHHYYSSLTALTQDNIGELNVSKGTLDRWDYAKKDFENQIIIIRKSHLVTNKMVQEYNEAADQALKDLGGA